METTMYMNRLDDLQMSVNEALSVLSLLLEEIEREAGDRANTCTEDKMFWAKALILRVHDTYLPALRMIERHLTAANINARHALMPQQQ